MVTTDVRCLNPFIVSALAILRTFDREATRAGELAFEEDDRTTDPVSVVVAVGGDVRGTAFFGMDDRTARAIAGALLGEVRRVRWDDGLVESALLELGNLVSAHASALLEEEGKRCAIAPPIVTLAPRLILSATPFERLVVPIDTCFGPVRLHLAIHEREAPPAHVPAARTRPLRLTPKADPAPGTKLGGLRRRVRRAART